MILFFDLINGANVGVVQSGSRPRLALKAAEHMWVPGDFIGQKFERHKPAQLDILGLVNHTHSATAQLLDDAVMGNGLADEGTGVLWRVFKTPSLVRFVNSR